MDTMSRLSHSSSVHLGSLQHKLHEERLDEPGLVRHGVLAGVDWDGLQRLLYHRLDVPAVYLAVVQELDALLYDGVPHTDHVLGQVLHQGQEASLGIEPGVSAQLLVVRLQGLDDSADAKLVVLYRRRTP